MKINGTYNQVVTKENKISEINIDDIEEYTFFLAKTRTIKEVHLYYKSDFNTVVGLTRECTWGNNADVDFFDYQKVKDIRIAIEVG